MCEFSPKTSHSTFLIPDYEIEMKYDYWSSTKSDYGSTSFVESEIIGMESFHKLNIPLIHLKTKSEKDDQEEREYDRMIKQVKIVNEVVNMTKKKKKQKENFSLVKKRIFPIPIF